MSVKSQPFIVVEDSMLKHLTILSDTNFMSSELSHLELLFLTVLAFPNASRTGFDCNQIR
jgi:hypothetical protein